jgi:hypothetical protein
VKLAGQWKFPKSCLRGGFITAQATKTDLCMLRLSDDEFSFPAKWSICKGRFGKN